MHFYLLYISYQQYIYIPDRLYHVQAFLVNICSHYVFKKLYAIFNFMSATMALTALGFRYRTDMFCTGFFYAFSTNTDSPCSWLPDTAAPCIERSSAIVDCTLSMIKGTASLVALFSPFTRISSTYTLLPLLVIL